jgi:hypothetical protein
MTGHDRAISESQERQCVAKLLNAAGEVVEGVGADHSRIGGIRPKAIERDLLDHERFGDRHRNALHRGKPGDQASPPERLAMWALACGSVAVDGWCSPVRWWTRGRNDSTAIRTSGQISPDLPFALQRAGDRHVVASATTDPSARCLSRPWTGSGGTTVDYLCLSKAVRIVVEPATRTRSKRLEAAPR